MGVHTRSVGGLSLHTRPVKKQIRLGENIKLPCSTIGPGYTTFYNPIIWYKVMGKEMVQLNDQAMVKQPFMATGRYTIKPIMEGGTEEPKVSMALHLEGVTLAESGIYRCELRQVPDSILDNVTHNITVVAPVDTLSFTSNETHIQAGDNTTNEQTTFELLELQPTYISCTAKGGNPRPTLKIYRDKLDITSEFRLKVEGSTSGAPGLEVTEHVTSLTSIDYRAPVSFRGSRLRCVARIHKAQDLRRSTSALIDVKYAPRFECERALRAWPGDVNVTITCHLVANPPVEVVTVAWSWSVPGVNDTVEEVRLRTSETYGDNYAASAQINDEGVVVASLVISNVTATSFGTYTLSCSNDISSAQEEITLSEAFTTMEPTTVAPTTELETTPAPKDTIIPEKDMEKSAVAVTGSGHRSLPWQLTTVTSLALVLYMSISAKSF